MQTRRSPFGRPPDAAMSADRSTGQRVMARWVHPVTSVRQRLRQWFHNRLPRTDTLTLTQRNVYILPTRAGWMLGLTLLLLLVGSINYQLNLGYLLTFLIAGCAVVALHVCHGNLRGLNLHLNPPAPVHVGQAVALEVRLSSERRRPRFGVGVRVTEATGKTGDWDHHLAWTDVPAQGSTTLQIAWAPPARGWHPLPVLTTLTRFPLGTVQAWNHWRPAAQVLVYPAPEVNPPPLPAGEPRSDGSGLAQSAPLGDFDGVRAYRRGDTLKTVVWKKAAQSFAAGRNDLVSRDASAAQRHQLWLDLAQTGTTGLEARLSRLTAWVLMAERLGLDYGLRLPGTDIAPDQGTAHQSRCLQALALA